MQVIRHEGGDGPVTALQRLRNYDRDYGYVMNKKKEFVGGVVSQDNLIKVIEDDSLSSDDLSPAMLEGGVSPVQSTDSMQDILSEVSSKPYPIPVVDENNKYIGVISKKYIFENTEQD